MAKTKPEQPLAHKPRTGDEMERVVAALRDDQIADEGAEIVEDMRFELLAARQMLEDMRNFVSVQSAKMARY